MENTDLKYIKTRAEIGIKDCRECLKEILKEKYMLQAKLYMNLLKGEEREKAIDRITGLKLRKELALDSVNILEKFINKIDKVLEKNDLKILDNKILDEALELID